jgi:tetratricopeptide (TPR) repeat protein
MDLDDLDDIDLGGDAAAASGAKPTQADDGEDPEVLGAMRFSEGEMALQSQEWDRAVELLESAYEYGIDVAELHAMLAYGRFKTAETDPEMQTHALELLDYAAELNPNLDVVFAYRGEILHVQGDSHGARAALQQALDINPYCDLALELMDDVG